MKIYRQYTQVEINLGKVKGYINHAVIEGNSVSYSIIYFDGDDYKFITMTEKEFTVINEVKKQEIGFK